MYQIKKQTETIKVDHIIFVKKQENGTIVSCPEDEAQGIVQESGDGFYNLKGKEPMGALETVATKELTISDDIHDALIYKALDDDFRFTLIEMMLGIE